MGKTLLQSFTGNSEAQENTATVGVKENKMLAELMQEMKGHLQDAAKDLMQPRQEAVESLLKKVLH
jgi:hypothetical protein